MAYPFDGFPKSTLPDPDFIPLRLGHKRPGDLRRDDFHKGIGWACGENKLRTKRPENMRSGGGDWSIAVTLIRNSCLVEGQKRSWLANNGQPWI